MLVKHLDVRVKGSQDSVPATVYLYEPSQELMTNVRPLIVVCPGGGYCYTSDREADPIAMQFVAMGYHAAVLRYSVAPARFPTALEELGSLIRQARENSAAWQIDPERIAVVGFSAGGHLVCSYCALWREPWVAQDLNTTADMLRPNGMILGYPVISSGPWAHHDSFQCLLGERYEAMKDELSMEKRVSDALPPAFIWHTQADPVVPVQNSLMLVAAMTDKHIPVEFHMFQNGRHGLALANWVTQASIGAGVEPPAAQWIPLLTTWLDNWRKKD
ncbi:MAG: alpha/beta hydrolase [Aristaeellaceae bacterium]